MRGLLKLFICVFIIVSAPGQASNEGQAFELFWAEFREAALNEDYSSLSKLIRFPLEVKGVDNNTPTEFYPPDKIAEIFPALLEQVVYSYAKANLEGNSVRELIRKKKEAMKILPHKTNCQIDQFEFQKVNGQWLLTTAYLE